jgi:hypothetical protein
MRWQALKANLAPQEWRPRRIPPSHGFATERVEEALHEACRRMGLVLVGEPVEGQFTRSRGAIVHAPDGALRWLKVNGVPNGPDHPMIKGEKNAAKFYGIPKPEVLEIREWTAGGVRWCAFLMTLAPKSATPQPLFSRRRDAISDRWIGELKQALYAIAAIHTERRRYDPNWIAVGVTERFGAGAPHAAEEWRTAHGDLNWGNLTAPDLLLLGGLWGLAPRGFDAAWLIAFSSPDEALTRRSLAAFVDDLDTPSGRGSAAYGLRRPSAACRGRPSRPALSLSDRIARAPRARNRLRSRATKRMFVR